MPIQVGKRTLLPDWMSEPSVMDPLYKRVIRGAGNLIGINDPTSGLPTPAPLGSVVSTVGTEVEKRVAPKRAAKELADLLMGRSSRVSNAGLKPITDQEAKMSALLSGKIGGVASPPTQIVIPNDKNFKGMARVLPRAPGITESYKGDMKLKGLEPKRFKTVAINTSSPNNSIMRNPIVSKQAIQRNEFYGLTKQTGSLHNAVGKSNLPKVMTSKEMEGLIEGPKKAFKEGLITRQELDSLLAQNQAKIDGYKNSLKQVDQTIFDDKLNNSIIQRIKPNLDMYKVEDLTSLIRAGKAHGATEAELANQHGIPIGMIKALLSRQF